MKKKKTCLAPKSYLRKQGNPLYLLESSYMVSLNLCLKSFFYN